MMGMFEKYSKPPAPQITQGELDQDKYEPQGLPAPSGDPFIGGGLPIPYDYGPPKPQWNAEMMDRLMNTDIDEYDEKTGKLKRERPKLWLFDTKAFRHFQLSNLRSRDQTEIERDIADILMLANQDGNEDMCQEGQIRVYAKLAMYKSRGDMPIQHRERDAWFTNVSELKQTEIARPKGDSGGFFSNLFGNKRRDY